MTFRQRNDYVRNAAAAAMLALMAAPAFAADVQYATELDPVAFDNSTVKNNVGIGNVTATLSGSALSVSGSYSGLSSEATAAHLQMGLGFGVAGGTAGGLAGATIGDLAISGGTSGQISGSVKLTSAQIAALKKGALYIVVDSGKAPQGNLWGWLNVPDQNQ